MGSFVFKWPKDAEEVYVTGTFDNWSKSAKLDKVGNSFEKSVELSDASSKIYYKFVVDGAWVTDDDAPKEKDEGGNDNNVLKPEDIIKSAPATAAFLTLVAPESSTVALAKDVPLEEPKAATVEETPVETAEPTAEVPAIAAAVEPKDKMADKSEAPATEAPVSELDKEVKLINPLPAAPGGLNPIKLAPGEKVPDVLTTADVNANVKLDPESYEKADTIVGGFTPSDLPPVSQNMIPESSLPIAGPNDVTINSVGPTSSTVALAGAVPLEKDKVAAPAEVKEAEPVKEEETAASSSAGVIGGISAAAAGIGAAAFATAVAAKDKALEQAGPAIEKATEAATSLPVSVKEALPIAVQEKIASASATTEGAISSEVPEEVKESIEESGFSPEAAANTEAVEEKKAVEAELLKKIPEAPGSSETAEAATEVNGKDAAPAVAAAAEPAAAPAVETPAKAAAPVAAAASPTTLEKKKKNRVSGFFSKIVHKLEGSDKKK